MHVRIRWLARPAQAAYSASQASQTLARVPPDGPRRHFCRALDVPDDLVTQQQGSARQVAAAGEEEAGCGAQHLRCRRITTSASFSNRI